MYAVSAKTGLGIFHPHHLLYSPVVRSLFLLTSRVSDSEDVILPGQIYNILWAIVTVISFFLLLYWLFGSPSFAFLGAIFFLITRGFWELATQNTVYISALGWLALITMFLFTRKTGQLNFRQQITLSVLLALSVLNHQANILFCIPLAYYLITTQNNRQGKTAVTVISFGGFIVFLMYILVFLLETAKTEWTVARFLKFCFYYAMYANPNWGTFEHFGFASIYNLLQSQVWNIVVVREKFQFIAIVIYVLFFAGIITWNVRQIVKQKGYKQLRIFLLLWIFTYNFFFLWWLPTYTHLFLITFFPMLLLGFLTVKDKIDVLIYPEFRKEVFGGIALMLILFIGVSNVNGTILPNYRSKGPQYQEAQKLDSLVTKNCVILTDYTTAEHLHYYFCREQSLTVPILLFYKSRPLPKKYFLEKETCIIELSYVVPRYKCVKFTGYTHPTEWLEYIKWLFNFQYGAEHKLVSCREFKVIIDKDGIPYLYLFPSKMEVESLQEIFQMLDKQVTEYYRLETNPFQTWLNATSPKL